ncbi:MAG: general secretion pathway protein GspB [Thiobacillus sp.]|nr:general secretion pathway protein GspB [Thiobacillus sp.]
MSYILDALKRADADRERGHVPGLHSQGEFHPATGPSASWRRPTAGVAAGLVLLTAAALTWWSLRTPEASEPIKVRTATASAEPASADTAPSATPGLPILAPEPAVETPTPATAPPPSAPPRPQPGQATSGVAEENVEADAEDMVDTATEAEDSVNAVTTQPPPPPPPSPSPQSTLPLRPAAPRPMATADASGRPPVKVSGSSYSQNPAHRMLIANGKVVHEGQEIEPGLKLETVGPRSAVLNHRGTLYNITY